MMTSSDSKAALASRLSFEGTMISPKSAVKSRGYRFQLEDDLRATATLFYFLFESIHEYFEYDYTHDTAIAQEMVGNQFDTVSFNSVDGGNLRFHWDKDGKYLTLLVTYHKVTYYKAPVSDDDLVEVITTTFQNVRKPDGSKTTSPTPTPEDGG